MEHIEYVRRKETDQPIGLHFNLKNHKKEDMIFQIIQTLKTEPVAWDPLRLQREHHWIDQLKTMEPHGLNEKNILRV